MEIRQVEKTLKAIVLMAIEQNISSYSLNSAILTVKNENYIELNTFHKVNKLYKEYAKKMLLKLVEGEV